MKSASVSLPILRLDLFIGLAYALAALAGTAGAQTPGPGQVGGMGQGGAPAGEFPSDRDNVTYGQRYIPAKDFPPENNQENKDANEDRNKKTSSDSSGEPSPPPEKRSAEGKVGASIESANPETGSPGPVNPGAQRK